MREDFREEVGPRLAVVPVSRLGGSMPVLDPGNRND